MCAGGAVLDRRFAAGEITSGERPERESALRDSVTAPREAPHRGKAELRLDVADVTGSRATDKQWHFGRSRPGRHRPRPRRPPRRGRALLAGGRRARHGLGLRRRIRLVRLALLPPARAGIPRRGRRNGARRWAPPRPSDPRSQPRLRRHVLGHLRLPRADGDRPRRDPLRQSQHAQHDRRRPHRGHGAALHLPRSPSSA